MNLKLLLFTTLRELVGKEEVRFHLSTESTCEDIKMKVALAYPKTIPNLKWAQVAVNQELVSWNTFLKEGDEVAFLLPVSGG